MREGEWVEGQEGPYEKGVVEAGVEARGTSGCIASRCMAIMPKLARRPQPCCA